MSLLNPLGDWKQKTDRNMDDTTSISPPLIVEDHLQRIYRLSEAHRREFMGTSLLMGITFLRLCIYRCPISLKKIGKSPIIYTKN